MFGLSIRWIKVLAIGAVLLTISGTIYAGYTFVTDVIDENSRLTTDNATLTANNATLVAGTLTQQDTIASLQRDNELQLMIFQDTSDAFDQARNQVDTLQDRLSRHELGYLAANKPGLVEGAINNATDSIGRCFEIAAGSPLTEAERTATVTSQTNRECPALANPNYRGE
tara:strand:- start:5793 stop:6302 length:510 start_codon:yes stop_codon:yes gene_type:complete